MKTTTRPAIVLFIYNRVHTTARVLEAIEKWGPSRLYIVGDGAKESKYGDSNKVQEVRKLVDSYNFSFETVTIFSDVNLGLTRRFVSGLDAVFKRESEAIILEDDCLPSESFFEFCASMLKRYESDQRVAVVSGNNFCEKLWPSENDYEFTLMPRTWGWATWARVWEGFEVELPDFDLNLAARVGKELTGSPFAGLKWAKTVRKSIASSSIWDHQFAYHLASRGLLSIYPRINLVQNIGFGSDATHTIFKSLAAQVQARDMPSPYLSPTAVKRVFDFGRLERSSSRRAWIEFATKAPLNLMIRLLEYIFERIKRVLRH